MHKNDISTDMLLVEVCRLHHERARELLECLGLHRGQPRLLRLLWEHEGLTHTDLAKSLRLRPSTVTKMIQRMERSGFVERRADPKDERVSRVFLTATGRAVKESTLKALRILEGEAFRGFKPEEHRQLGIMLAKVRDNLSAVSTGKDSK